MLCRKLFFAMKHKNSKNLRQHRCQFVNIIVLSVMWTMLFTETMARPNILNNELLSNDELEAQQEQQQQEQLQQQEQQQAFLSGEIMTSANNEKLFNKMQKYHHNQPNYLNKWPRLRDLVSTADYDERNGYEENNEFLNTNFFERLRHLASLKSDYEDDMRYESGDANLIPAKSFKSSSPLSANQLLFKDRHIKKNVQFHKQYMSPCHFKICNMGRKRNARFFKMY